MYQSERVARKLFKASCAAILLLSAAAIVLFYEDPYTVCMDECMAADEDCLEPDPAPQCPTQERCEEVCGG
jgi:hypothetical protein